MDLRFGNLRFNDLDLERLSGLRADLDRDRDRLLLRERER